MATPAYEKWIEDNSPIHADKLHAIGVVSYQWNQCEFWLFHIFCEVADLPEEKAWTLVYDLGDVAICTRIAVLLRGRGFHADGVALINNALKYYDLCRQNRNALVHAWTRGPGFGAKLARKSREPDKMEPAPFPSDLDDIRRVAEEIAWLSRRLWILTVFLNEGRMALAISSPKILTLPELLLKPPLPANTKPKRQPRSSPASRRKAALARKT